MDKLERKLIREEKTIEIMIIMYCKTHHVNGEVMCNECEELQSYAKIKLEKCPQIHNKPTCARCTIHCYKPEKREKIRDVMRYSGPRMLKKHPIMAIRHLINMLKKPVINSHLHLKN